MTFPSVATPTQFLGVCVWSHRRCLNNEVAVEIYFELVYTVLCIQGTITCVGFSKTYQSMDMLFSEMEFIG